MNYPALYTVGLGLLEQTFGGSVDVYRSPAASGGTVGALAQVGTALACIIVPATAAQRLGPPPDTLAGARADWYGIAAAASDMQLGDELRQGTVRYKVIGAAPWVLGKVLALSQAR